MGKQHLVDITPPTWRYFTLPFVECSSRIRVNNRHPANATGRGGTRYAFRKTRWRRIQAVVMEEEAGSGTPFQFVEKWQQVCTRERLHVYAALTGGVHHRVKMHAPAKAGRQSASNGMNSALSPRLLLQEAGRCTQAPAITTGMVHVELSVLPVILPRQTPTTYSVHTLSVGPV